MLKDYYPFLVIDRNDNEVDYVVMVNDKITPEQFQRCIDDAIVQLKKEGYDYDGDYWAAICEKLPDWVDFATWDYPDKIYY